MQLKYHLFDRKVFIILFSIIIVRIITTHTVLYDMDMYDELVAVIALTVTYRHHHPSFIARFIIII